jgi:hypothetical protein
MTVDTPALYLTSLLGRSAVRWRGLINIVNHVRWRTVWIAEKEHSAIRVH